MTVMEKDNLDQSPLDSGVLNDTPISVILSQAVKIKSAQQASLRKDFDNLPNFLQNTIFSSDEISQIRQKSFEDRLDEAYGLKNQGNSYYQAGKFYEAKAVYESAISIFRFLTNINPSWKEIGIRDEDIRQEAFDGENENQSLEIKNFLVNCYNNLALSCIRVTPPLIQDAIQACSAAIHINPEHAKSYYLRGKSRLTNRSCGKSEERLALQDLQKAKYLDPSNKHISLLYSKIRMDMSSAKQRERKTFQGMFDNGMTLGYEMNSTKGPNEDKPLNNQFRSDRILNSRFAVIFVVVLASRLLLGKVFPMTISRVESAVDKF
jgi:tetratricopeptide (TPR) repeat protein